VNLCLAFENQVLVDEFFSLVPATWNHGLVDAEQTIQVEVMDQGKGISRERLFDL
jgi:hypothetical protein